MARIIIPEALQLIKRTEKCSLKPYQGRADGKGIITIGYGHVIRPGEDWMKKGITQAQADKIFAEDVQSHAQFIEQDFGHPLNDYEFGALASAAFNLGARFIRTAPSLQHGLWNLYKFSNANGIFCDGVFYRRLTEIALVKLKTLVAKPDNCVQAMALLKLMGLELGEVASYFERKHRRDLCTACRHLH